MILIAYPQNSSQYSTNLHLSSIKQRLIKAHKTGRTKAPSVHKNFDSPPEYYVDYVHPESKLDLVYTYVDGSDPIWLENKKKFHPVMPEDMKKYINPDHHMNDENRYTDHSELKYSLRSVEKHFPWVNNIFIVVALESQVPKWLNISHPKIHIVLHKDIFVGEFAADLPVFRSGSIELHLFRIPGLSDNYIYLNDDFFFGQNITMENFYTVQNGHKIYLDKFASKRVKEITNILHSYGIGQNIKIRVPSHAPYFFNKQIVEEVWKYFEKDMIKSSHAKFRRYDAIEIHFAYIFYIQAHPGWFKSTDYVFNENITWWNVFNKQTEDEMKLFEDFFEKPSTFFCLQDADEGLGSSKKQVYQMLINKFPEVSAFEIA
eukprot:snap_masked-scaffold_3-processed-gene-18.34-mRNA-1 protein AED:0.27 eAED:0.27 QI:0/0/0/0.5/1/1/2/0/373